MAENNIPGVSEEAKKLVDNYNQWINPHVNRHVKLDGPKIPDAPTPQVNTLDERKLRNELDYKNNIPQTKIDTTVGKPTDADVKAEDVRIKTDGKARIAEDKEKYQEEQEAKHRKAEKMWSAIGDGISAIANMATVGAGADSMYNPDDSLHSKVKSKWDEIKANKAKIAAVNRKAQMDLLLKKYELGVKSKEAEANRNFNIWKTETEEAGRNQRAKEEQEFKASEGQKNRDNDKEVAKIRGKYSRSSGGGSSSEPKFYATNPNGGRHTWKSPQQGVGEMMRWMQANGYKDNIPTKGLWEDIDTRYANVYAAYEDAVADWQSKQSNDNQIDLSGL